MDKGKKRQQTILKAYFITKLSHPDHPNILIFITQSTRQPTCFDQNVLLVKKKKKKEI